MYDPSGQRAVENDHRGAWVMVTNSRRVISSNIDLTKKLDDYMKRNAEDMADYRSHHTFLDTFEYFIDCVNDDAVYDIKLQDDWKFEEGRNYYFRYRKLRYDDPGNINFGYVGAVFLPEIILCMGAGFNQFTKYGFTFGDITTFFDDPRDNEMIKWGCSLYDEKRK